MKALYFWIRDRSDRNHELAVFGFLMVAMLAIGTLGFSYLEDWTLFQSAYATIITLTSIGYGDFAPETTGGRVFAIVLVSFGLGTVAYVFSSLANLFLSAEARDRSRRRRMQRMIDHVENHVIFCGFGEMGRNAARVLQSQGQSCVVIEIDEKVAEEAEGDGFLVLHGTAADDELLERAGLARAQALLAVTRSDAENVFITLSAREVARRLRDDQRAPLRIIARANDAASLSKLQRAGADRVISPHVLGAERMASLVSRPNVADFLDRVLADADEKLGIEEIEVSDDSGDSSLTWTAAEARRRHGVTVMALREPDGQTLPSPAPDSPFPAGSVLLCFGTREGLHALSRELRGSASGTR